MANWTDEDKQEVVDMYTDQSPTSDTSIEIVKAIAEDFDKTSNAIRLILSKAGVYVKGASKSAVEAKDKPKKVSKADCIAELVTAIETAGGEVDMDIIDKFTGKAATYLAGILSK